VGRKEERQEGGGGYEKTDGTFYGPTIDDYFKGFALCGDQS